ncbi:iron-containing redox enzyme family protein [Acinetobacter sp. WU_MDCI_Abxe161]|uniref:iron-containing redox enzyme family protein n=1 Tax=Acinetobacter sp. WU_MDCI_Abxe161 TaxID=2850074 RepID=UPI0021CD352C|nr:iron-containing redox enzyme family protein [Acinetobacter sp. WU_MDCI_Abxe161]MCU4503491.1 iron-containing redox enzyme family protein [Acinetobacter sp. WU_MDCI_Abxe161]
MENFPETEINDSTTHASTLSSWLHSPLHKTINYLINKKDLDLCLRESTNFKNRLLESIQTKLEDAFLTKNSSTNYEIHSTLYQLYNLQICDPLSNAAINQHQPFFYEIRNKIEEFWLNFLNLDFIYNSKDTDETISDLILSLCSNMNLSEHPLFNFLAKEASERQLFAFFNSDYELNVRFFDLLLLTLLNSPTTGRMEMIKNLWDESGKGNRKETHVNMFNDLIENFELDNKILIEPHDTWQKLAGYNLFMLASLNRKYYYLLLGIMAATEIIDPQSYIKVQEACKRYNMNDRLYRYYSEHSEIDVEHAKGWLTNVIEPIVAANNVKHDILLGTYFRLKTCNDYYDSLYQYLKAI